MNSTAFSESVRTCNPMHSVPRALCNPVHSVQPNAFCATQCSIKYVQPNALRCNPMHSVQPIARCILCNPKHNPMQYVQPNAFTCNPLHYVPRASISCQSKTWLQHIEANTMHFILLPPDLAYSSPIDQIFSKGASFPNKFSRSRQKIV